MPVQEALMPLDARDGHAAVSRAAKMRAGLPTRADNRAGSARGAIERTLLGLQKKSTGKVAPYLYRVSDETLAIT